MKRYHLVAEFKEEQRKGFVVTHALNFETDSQAELNDKIGQFTSDYNHKFCHSMKLQLIENQTKLG